MRADVRAKMRPSARSALAALAVTDDAAIETKIRRIWGWADDLLKQEDDFTTVEALRALQDRMSEALNILASLLGFELEMLDACQARRRPASVQIG